MIGNKVIFRKMMTVENDGHYLGKVSSMSESLTTYFGMIVTECSDNP